MGLKVFKILIMVFNVFCLFPTGVALYTFTVRMAFVL